MEAPRDICIYKITCTKNSRIYVGQSIDPKKRYRQHKYRPPSRMKLDVQKYKPFEDYFKMDILFKSINKKDCDAFELETIATLQTLGKNGYNITLGTPCKDSKFRYLRSKGIL
ncbi:hypothetical protein M758_8G161900 [Ceratodon purpureus]|nr:hypothetical protein M758_8G161900 [Ceratodon purpureus]